MKKTLLNSVLAGVVGLGFAQEKAKLILPPNAPFHKEFGYSISMTHNNKMVIGAEFEEQKGAVYLYDNNEFTKKISAIDFDESANNFGSRSIISQNWLAVSAPGASTESASGAGKIYMFFDPTYQSNFGDEPTFVIEGTEQFARLGRNIKMENGWLIASTYNSRTKLYVFQASGWGDNARWDLKSTVTSPTGESIQDFAMSDNKLVITTEGDYWEDTKGDLFVFERDWTGSYSQKFQRSTQPGYDWATYRYGKSVDINHNLIIVSDENADKAEVLSGSGNYYNIIDVLSKEDAVDYGEHVKIKNNRALVSYMTNDGSREVAMYSQEWNGYQFKNNLDYNHNSIDSKKALHVITLGENDMVGIAIKDSPNPGVYGNDRGAAYVGNFADLTKSRQDSYEGNNSMNEATSIQIDRTYASHTSSSSDNDYYKLEWLGGPLTAKIASTQGANYVEVLNGNGTVLAAFSNNGYGSEREELENLPAGDIYFRVQGTNGDYDLTLTGSHCDVYSGEPNNSRETASEIFANGALGRDIYGAVLTTTDEDWFTFEKPDFGQDNLLISLTEVAGDYDIYLYNEQNSLVAYSVAWGASDEQIFVQDIPEGRYFLRLRGWAGANSADCYTLNINFTNNATSRIATVQSEDVSTKLINEPGFAATIFPSPAVSGDLITLETSEEDTVQQVKIYSISGALVASIKSASKGGEFQFVAPDLEAGTYIVKTNSSQARLIIE